MALRKDFIKENLNEASPWDGKLCRVVQRQKPAPSSPLSPYILVEKQISAVGRDKLLRSILRAW